MAASEGATKTDRQLVVFSLASAAYGVDIGSVREIIRMQEITRVPNAPELIEGVINLRGKICPVVDLCKRFEVEATRRPTRAASLLWRSMARTSVSSSTLSMRWSRSVKGRSIQDRLPLRWGNLIS